MGSPSLEYISFLLAIGSDEERTQHLLMDRPENAEESPNWWLGLSEALALQLRSEWDQDNSRNSWREKAKLLVLILELASSTQDLSPQEVKIRQLRLAATLTERFDVDEFSDILRIDPLVNSALALIPISFAEAEDLTRDWRHREIETIAMLRRI